MGLIDRPILVLADRAAARAVAHATEAEAFDRSLRPVTLELAVRADDAAALAGAAASRGDRSEAVEHLATAVEAERRARRLAREARRRFAAPGRAAG